MSTSRIVGIGMAGVLVIGLAVNSGRVALGQKEGNPAQGDKGAAAGAGKFVGLTEAEQDIAKEIGRRGARLEMLNLSLENRKHAFRRYSDLKIDLEFQSRANPPGLSARESKERLKQLDSQSAVLHQLIQNLSERLDSTVAEFAAARVELYLLAKKNGLPDLTPNPVANPSLESIERNLKAIEAKLLQPASNGK